MQTIELSLDHPFLFCPVTGQIIVDEDGVYESPALAFSYYPEIAEFNFIKPNFLEIYEECQELENTDEDIYAFDLFLEKMKNFENHVMFSITTFGFACGPVSETIHYCFDMNYSEEE
jgi:hypothetical protein